MQNPKILVCAFLALSGLSRAQDCPLSSSTQTGTLTNPEMNEASGLAMSRINPGVLYTHNDHGDSNRFFAILDDGFTIAQIILEGVVHEDFEDIALGPGPVPGVSYVYLGDIGNNDGDSRSLLQVYRFPEPDLTGVNNEVVVVDASEIARFEFSAPSQDTETLMVDPLSGDVYVVEKNQDAEDANIYKFSPPAESATVGLRNVGNIAYDWFTGGDIAADGSRIVLRQGHGHSAAWQWFRDPAATVEDTLMNTLPCELIVDDEEQSEAIAIDVTMTGLYTTSEGDDKPILYYAFED